MVHLETEESSNIVNPQRLQPDVSHTKRSAKRVANDEGVGKKKQDSGCVCQAMILGLTEGRDHDQSSRVELLRETP